MTRADSTSAVLVNRSIARLPSAMGSLWSRTSFVGELWHIVQCVGVWPGVRIIENRSGFALAVNGVTLGHLKWCGQMTIAFGPEARCAIADEKMGGDEPGWPDGDVMVLNIRSATDVDRALCLLRFAYLIS